MDHTGSAELISMVALSELDANSLSRALQYKNQIDCKITKPDAQALSTQIDGTNEKIINELHQQQKRLSSTEIPQIVAGYKSGQTVYELAETFGCHRVTISSQLKANGIKLRRSSPSGEQIDQMVRLYKTGLSMKDVGERVGMSAATVMRSLYRRGIETRDPHGRVK
jgi:lambda repressor-like predicted transcriptional regulator